MSFKETVLEPLIQVSRRLYYGSASRLDFVGRPTLLADGTTTSEWVKIDLDGQARPIYSRPTATEIEDEEIHRAIK